jgi:hypothetical protein
VPVGAGDPKRGLPLGLGITGGRAMFGGISGWVRVGRRRVEEGGRDGVCVRGGGGRGTAGLGGGAGLRTPFLEGGRLGTPLEGAGLALFLRRASPSCGRVCCMFTDGLRGKNMANGLRGAAFLGGWGVVWALGDGGAEVVSLAGLEAGSQTWLASRSKGTSPLQEEHFTEGRIWDIRGS